MHSLNSCHRFLHRITTPTMFMIAKDDPITQWSSVPVDDLKRNKNFLLAFSDAGGHCEWYYSDEKKQKYLRYTP